MGRETLIRIVCDVTGCTAESDGEHAANWTVVRPAGDHLDAYICPNHGDETVESVLGKTLALDRRQRRSLERLPL